MIYLSSSHLFILLNGFSSPEKPFSSGHLACTCQMALFTIFSEGEVFFACLPAVFLEGHAL